MCEGFPCALGWLDDCCRPLIFHLAEMNLARVCFMGDLLVELEANHPEVVQALMAKVLSMFSIDEDGALKTPYGKAIWKPHQPAIVRTYEDVVLSFPTVAAAAIATVDLFQAMSATLCSVAPQPILDVIAATPTGTVAQKCESAGDTGSLNFIVFLDQSRCVGNHD